MPGFDGPYLRVLTPKTSNGVTPIIDEMTGKVVYREDHLPLSAKKGLEKENKYLPNHLKHKIEEVGAYYPPNQTFVTPVVQATDVPIVEAAPKRNGRPKGSKNKAKS